MHRAALVAILIIAACTSNSETGTTSAAAPTLTTLPTATVPPVTTTTAPPPETTAAPSTTTTTLPPNAAPAFGLTQVVFGESSLVIITNWGDGPGTLAGHWLGQDQSYMALPEVMLGPGEQALIGLARTPPPELAGMAATVFLGPAIGTLEATAGEVALFGSDAFADPASLVAYVEWGAPGHGASDEAIAAGLWGDDPVQVFDDAPSISSGVFPATSSLDWAADVGG